MKKKLLIIEPELTILYYKLLYILKEDFDITLISLSKGEKNLEDLYKKEGIKFYSFNIMGQRFLKDKKIFSGIKEISKFIFTFIKTKLFTKYDFVLAMGGEAIGYFLFKTTLKSKKIWFPYDIQLFAGKVDKKERSKFDIKTERYCFENADFIFHKGDENEFDLIKKNEIGNIKAKTIQFLPYCFDKWIIPVKKRGGKLRGLHLVYIGTYMPNNPGLKISSKDVFKIIAQQKIDLHVYSKNFKEENLERYIHKHEEIPNQELNKKMGMYHYGLLVVFHKKNIVDERFFKTCIAHKICSYLEAGIPVIINKDFEFMASLIKKYQCGVVISEKDLPNLKDILKKQNYPKLIMGVEKAREELKLSNQRKRILNELK